MYYTEICFTVDFVPKIIYLLAKTLLQNVQEIYQNPITHQFINSSLKIRNKWESIIISSFQLVVYVPLQ